MATLSFMNTREKTDPKSAVKLHLKQLIQLSKVDGAIAPPEAAFIQGIGAKHGLDQAEIKALTEESCNVQFTVPNNDSERFDHIFNFVHLMLIDGIVDEKEIDFCIDKAEKLGFRKAIVGVLIRKISSGIAKVRFDRNAMKLDAGNYLRYPSNS